MHEERGRFIQAVRRQASSARSRRPIPAASIASRMDDSAGRAEHGVHRSWIYKLLARYTAPS
jgi:hypothetical protein